MTRHVPFTAVFNFRDLGGYPGHDGRTVAWRRLYRSDTLHRLAEEDFEAFTALGIRTVLDLRRPSEVERDGRVPELPDLAYRHVHPEHEPWRRDMYDPGAGAARFFADRYLELAEQGAAGLVTALGLIADPDAAPLVMHCVGGKDRTGVVSALTLHLLGVSDVDIARDYALTDLAEEKFAAWLRRHHPEVLVDGPPPELISSPPEGMLMFLAELRERYGSVREYLTGAGLTSAQVDTLRRHLLD